MKDNDELAELIGSMSSSEKRYFKLQASTFKEDSHYLLLFDAIDKNLAAEDGSIAAYLKSQGVNVPLSRLKNYLQQLIMKTLREYHLEHYPEFKIIEAYRDFKIQRDRNLPKQAMKSLQKAIKLAKQYERYAYLFELIRNVSEDFLFEPDPKKFSVQAHGQMDELDAIVKKLELINHSHRLCNEAIAIQKEHIKTTGEDKASRVQDMLTEAQTLLAKQDLPAYCFMYLYTVLNISTAQLNQYNKSYENTSKLVTMLESKGVQMGVGEAEIFYTYTNQLYHLLYGHKDAEFKALAASIIDNPDKYFLSKSPYFPAALQFTAYAFEVSYALLNGRYHEALPFIEPAQKIIQKYPTVGNPEFVFSWHYRLLILYFGLERYNEALDLINLMLEGKILRYGPDFGSYIRMLNLIVHHELGNHKLLPSAMKATEQFVRNRGNVGIVDKLLLEMLKKYTRTATQTEGIAICKTYAEKIQAIVADKPEERTPLIYFDFLTWMNGKVDGISFPDAIRQKKESAGKAD